jgi:hypothetical protein
MSRTPAFLITISLLILPTAVFAQSDPQAIAFAAQSIAALTSGTQVTDITLKGNATRTLGSQVGSGPGTFSAKGLYESRLDLNLSNGTRSEIRNSTSTPKGEWIDSNNNAHPFSQFNCLTDAVWFYPAFSSLASATNSNQILKYVGPETLNGESVQHLNSVWFNQPLITMDFYLDATTFLPVAVNFNSHPDSDSSTNIAVQILFSNYQNLNGVLVPYHIQESVNGSVLLDFATTNAVVNSGLSDTLFTIQ